MQFNEEINGITVSEHVLTFDRKFIQFLALKFNALNGFVMVEYDGTCDDENIVSGWMCGTYVWLSGLALGLAVQCSFRSFQD